MIRVTFLLRRKAELSLDDFQQYWRESHGPLVASVADDLDMLRYVQVHTLGDHDHSRLAGPRAPMEVPYDGVAEVWWRSKQALIDATRSTSGRTADATLLADETRFIDLANSAVWFNYEYPQVNPTPEDLVASPGGNVVKLYFPLRHLESLSLEDAQHYWRTHHGPLIRSQAAGSAILRYVQVHRDEPDLTEAMRASRGCTIEPYSGHAELWLDRSLMGDSSQRARTAAKRAYADESTFIDFARSSMWLAEEHVFVDKRLG